MEVNIEWSTPYQVKVGTTNQWRRTWLIPEEQRSAFFDFWRETKFQLLSDGFRVYKEEEEWYLSETKLSTSLFKRIGITRPISAVPQMSDFVLPDYEIKEKSGLRLWQIPATSRLVSAINQWGSAIDGSDTGCHAKGQLILMADGHTKKVEDIIVGDEVMGWQGSQIVTDLKRGKQQMVRIVPTKGESFVVNMDHVLTVKTLPQSTGHKTNEEYERGKIYDISVRKYLSLKKTTKQIMKLLSSGPILNWKPEYTTPISSYFIGLLLGDGGMSSRSTVTITSASPEIWAAVEKECARFGWKLGNTNEDITKRITNSPDLFQWLRSNKLFPVACENKYVPHECKSGMVISRLEILAGLLDTDGYYYKKGNTYEITLKSKQLSDDIVFMARSLGLAAHTKPCKKKCSNGAVGDYFRTHISGNIDIIPCRIPHKKASPRKQIKNVLHRGFDVELLGEGDYYGFSLSGDGRFLLGDFTVTHNTGKTYSACAVARELSCKVVVVCPKSVIRTWGDVIKQHFKMGENLIKVINYEQLRIGKTSSEVASFIVRRGSRRKEFVWKIPKDTLIIWDESQKLKNWKTKNAKTCIAAFRQGFRQLFCSATNATNPLELRTVGLCLKLFNSSQTAWFQWLGEHGCKRGIWGMEFTSDPKLRQKVLKKLHKDVYLDRGVRLRRDTIPNFPECELYAVLLDMDKKDEDHINAIYSEMEKELKELEKLQKLDKRSHLVVELRCRQKIELTKVPLFIDMIEEAKEQGFSIAVFLNFTDTITALANRLGIKCIFDGKTPDNVRDENVLRFQNNDEQIILINVASGGFGLSLHDLHGGHPRLAIISPSYSPNFMRQAIGRIWRDDAKTKGIQKLVCVANTVEENVYNNVIQKLENLDLLQDGDLQYAKNYEVVHN